MDTDTDINNVVVRTDYKPFPKVLSRAKRVSKPDGQTFEFTHETAVDEADLAAKLANGWYATPLEAEKATGKK